MGKFPLIDPSGSSVAFSCPAVGTYSEVNIYPSFFSQVGTFFPIVGLLFTVAIYGTTSIFGYMTTCLLDDIVILVTFSIPSQIFSWYTFSKPMWIWILATMLSDFEAGIVRPYGDYYQYIVAIGCIFIVSAATTLIVFGVIRYKFHQYRAYFSEKKNSKHNNRDYEKYKRYFSHVKTAIIWIYFVHSAEVIVYSALQYKYVFSVLLNIHLDQQTHNGVDATEKSSSANLLTLNYFLKLLYFISSTVLVSTYHFPNLEKYVMFWRDIETRSYRSFIRKRTFFLTVILSLLQIFFEYYWFCTPSIISTVFNTILTTVLTRAIASFFSSQGIVKYIYKKSSGEDTKENQEVKKSNVYAQIQISDIFNIRRFSINKSGSGRNVLDPNPDSLERYKISKVRGNYYVTKKINDTNNNAEKVTQSEKTKTKQYYYPLPVDDSMYFIEFELDEKKNTDGDIIIDVDKKKETKKSKDDQICDGIENVTKDLNTDKIVFYELENGKIGQQDGRGVPNFVPTEDTTEPPTIANDDERITTDTNHAKKVTGRKYMKIDGYVLINILETGFLNYIIYSHRST
ncbi:17846_t:CDS:2, partial [Entrophospora sp. SA101]